MTVQGMIFDIQRFSVHDGPGIRTTVFMKGCPLRCAWCHNPEGLQSEKQLKFVKNECAGCGRCGNRSTLTDAEQCPTGALQICGREVTVDEVLVEVLRDRDFYCGGGVTFSGGECLMQADFVAAVLRKLKDEQIHTAVDTSGYVPWNAFEKTMPYTDLYLYDIKFADSSLHRQYTGVPNERILQNLHRLAGCGKAIWIRVPVIPGCNDNDEEMNAVLRIVQKYPQIEKVTLMPYHTLGMSKYETLGMEPAYQTNRMIEKSRLDAWKKLFSDNGITAD